MLLKHSFLWIFGILALTAAVLLSGWQEIKGLLAQVNPIVLILLCLLQLGTLALSAYGWHFLMRKLAPGHSFGRVFATYLGGNFVESITPASKLGGEAARVYLFRRLTSLPYTQLAGVLMAHKYISLLPFVVLCTIILVLSMVRFELPPLFLPAFFALIGLFTFLTLLLRRRPSLAPETSQTGGWQNKLTRVMGFLETASGQAQSLATSWERSMLLLLSLFIWALYPVKVYLVTEMLGFKVDLLVVAMATYSAYMISMIPLLPGGLGTFEGSMALVFALSGLSPAAGLTVALISRLVTYWFSLILSAVAAAGLALETNPLHGTACRPDSLRGPP